MHKLTLSVAFAACTLASQQLVPGALHGGSLAVAAGDVNDDGYDDYVVRMPLSWAVRSGQSGQVFTYLQPTAVPTSQNGYLGLKGDLNADGCDDLLLFDESIGVARYVSGADGTYLFQLAGPELQGEYLAADHNADGYDDVMVRTFVATGSGVGIRTWKVHSGKDGSVIDSYAHQVVFQNSAFFYWWCGDVNGDGYVDLLKRSIAAGSADSEVFAGPDFTASLGLFANEYLLPSADTNGDGVDEVYTSSNQVIDVLSGQVVWSPGVIGYGLALRVDVDGDGAHDLVVATNALSGRTQQPWPVTGFPSGLTNLGDIDADGRDELASWNVFYDLQGGPAASYIRDRGHGGMTSTGSTPRISHRLRPRLGDNLLVDLRGAGGQSLAFLALGSAQDIDLAPFGAPGNNAYVAPITAPWLLTDPSGGVRYVLAVPATTSLVGIELSAQWAVVDSAANALGIVTSNALDFVVGN